MGFLVFLVIGMTFLVIGLTMACSPTWSMICLFPIFAGILMCFFSLKADDYFEMRKQIKEYKLNNQDLKINYRTVNKIIRHIKKNSDYSCVTFLTVGNLLEYYLRDPKSFDLNNLKEFQEYVIFGYLFLETKK